MALLTPLSVPDATLLVRAFGLELRSLVALEDGSVNSNFKLETTSGEKFFARIYEEQGKAGAIAELNTLRELAAQGLPMATPPKPISGEEPLTHQGKPFAIYPWIDGEILCLKRVTPAHVELLGESLAMLHLASPKLAQISEGRFGPEKMLERLASVDQETGNREQRGISVEELRRDVSWIRSKLQHYLRQRDASLPSGIIHGDLFRDNVLWANGAIAALLDFESASRGTFVYDLMVCIEAWCFTDRFETERVAALLSGYQRKRPLSPAEIQGLETEGALVALRFATTRITDFSLRATPGEKPKRDYRRFIDRLSQIEAGALREVISR